MKEFLTPNDGIDVAPMYLREWEVRVVPLDQDRQFAEKAAVDYVLAGIKAGFLLNGGALVVLPPLVIMFNINTTCGRGLLITAAAAFIIGLALVGLTTILAFSVMLYLGMATNQKREHVARTIQKKYYGENDRNSVEILTEIAGLRDKLQKRSDRLQAVAICTAISSAVAFVAGAISLLYLAWS